MVNVICHNVILLIKLFVLSVETFIKIYLIILSIKGKEKHYYNVFKPFMQSLFAIYAVIIRETVIKLDTIHKMFLIDRIKVIASLKIRFDIQLIL